MKTAQINPSVYEAAHQSAILVDRSDMGMLKINGDTRLDLIHRMSTQDVKNLQSGEGAATILTTDVGRMIDRLILYVAGDVVYALTGDSMRLFVGMMFQTGVPSPIRIYSLRRSKP